jgi:hypothetical protein
MMALQPSGRTPASVSYHFGGALLIVIASEIPPWLLELHEKLWNRKDLSDEIFRVATLTREDFLELQDLLRQHNSSHQEAPEGVFSVKSAFLHTKSVPLSS